VITEEVKWPAKLLIVNTNELGKVRSEDKESINKCLTIVAHSISAIAERLPMGC
jgi:hypothetical protein